MTDVCLMFEVHQPFRLNRNFHSDLLAKGKVTKKGLFDLYFDNGLNRYVFERAARKCYFPTNNIILEQIEQSKSEGKPFKVTYGISGVFLEQCEMWKPELIESFRQLAETGCERCPSKNASSLRFLGCFDHPAMQQSRSAKLRHPGCADPGTVERAH